MIFRVGSCPHILGVSPAPPACGSNEFTAPESSVAGSATGTTLPPCDGEADNALICTELFIFVNESDFCIGLKFL